MHYNTNHKSGEALAVARGKTSAQDENVQRCTLALHALGKQMTPRRIWWIYQRSHGPVLLTSVRRSINTLIQVGFLRYRKINDKYNYIAGKCPVDGLQTREREIILNV